MSIVISTGFVTTYGIGFETVVQTAVYNNLANNLPLMSAVVAVYDEVPQPNSSGAESNFPYVTIGEDNHVSIDTDTELMDQVSITIHTWSRQSGRKQTKLIQGLIFNSLNRANLIESGYKFINISRVDSQSFLDSDGFTRHGVQTFNLMIEEL
jgi:hypothetical protein